MSLLLRFGIVLVCACGTKSTSPPADPPAPLPGTAALGSGSGDSGDSARLLRDLILEINAHVIVLKSGATFAEYRHVLWEIERDPDVRAAEPFIFLDGSIASASRPAIGFNLKAVDPQRVAGVLDLGAHLKAGKLRDLEADEPPAIILGDALAEQLAVRVGDRVTVTLPESGTPVAGAAASEASFRVTGIFHASFETYNEQLAYASLEATQHLLNRGDQVMGIELKVKDIDRAGKVAKAIERTLGGSPYMVMDWYETNRELFTSYSNVSPDKWPAWLRAKRN